MARTQAESGKAQASKNKTNREGVTVKSAHLRKPGVPRVLRELTVPRVLRVLRILRVPRVLRILRVPRIITVPRVPTFLLLPLFAALLAAQSTVTAHHAFSSEFDINKPIELRGVITRMEWVNPHTWLHMTATLEDGTTEDWMLEGGTPNTLLRAGLTQTILQPGTEINVRGYQSKDPDCIPKCRGSGRDITFADGRSIFMGSSGVGAPPTENR